MRGWVVLASGVVAVLAGCSDPAAEVASQWGCGKVDGLRQITGQKAPAYILVGEFTETREAPAAFAEIACHLASHQGEEDGPLFVGLTEYVSGATDAEIALRQRLDEIKRKGAPIVVDTLASDDHPYTVRQRSAAEARWAKVIEARVKLAGARRALLLLPRTDAIADDIAPRGDRFAGYSPMATHLPEGQVLALEIGPVPAKNLEAPAVQLYPAMTDGFHGQVVLASLTRPAVETLIAESRIVDSSDRMVSIFNGISISDSDIAAVLRPEMNRDERLAALTTYLEKRYDAEFASREARRKEIDEAVDDPFIRDMFKSRTGEIVSPEERRRVARVTAEQLLNRSWGASPPPMDTAPIPDALSPPPELPLDLPEFEIEN